MPIRNDIAVFSYRDFLGYDSEVHEEYKTHIAEIIREKLIDIDVENVEVYNMSGVKMHPDTNSRHNKKRLIIALNATVEPNSESVDIFFDDPPKVNNIEVDINTYLHISGSDTTTLIYSSEGMVLAEWHEEKYLLCILVDLFGLCNERRLSIFQNIMEEFNNKIWRYRHLKFSWIHTPDKEKLTDKVLQQIKDQKDSYLRELRRTADNMKDRCEQLRRDLRLNHDTMLQKQRIIETETIHLEQSQNKLVEELDIIVNHPKVKDLHIKENIFHIFTEHLDIYDENNQRYKGGEYEITIDMSTSQIRFFGKNCRVGFWTTNDPHPHVDGNNGIPCLGTAAEVIAELCSQYQLYGVVLTCIDFLESVYTRDSAGERVRSWDMIDEDGNIMAEGDVEGQDLPLQCYRCESYFHPSDLTIVYQYIDDNDAARDEMFVCHYCRDDFFTYLESYDCYISNEYATECKCCDELFFIRELYLAYENQYHHTPTGEHKVCLNCREYYYTNVNGFYIDDINVEEEIELDDEDDEEEEEMATCTICDKRELKRHLNIAYHSLESFNDRPSGEHLVCGECYLQHYTIINNRYPVHNNTAARLLNVTL